MDILLDRPTLTIQANSPALAEHRFHRPLAQIGITPPSRPPGHTDGPDPRILETVQSLKGNRPQLALGGDGVINIGEQKLYGSGFLVGQILQCLHTVLFLPAHGREANVSDDGFDVGKEGSH